MAFEMQNCHPNATVVMNTTSAMTTMSFISISDSVTLTVTMMSLLLFTGGLFGNTLVLLVYTQRYSLSTFREFIRILAVLDLCGTILGVPLTFAALLLARHPISVSHAYSVLVSVTRFVTYAVVSSSVFVLLVIAIDRYIRVCYPHRPALNVSRARFVCGAAAVAACVLNLPAAFASHDPVGKFHYAETGFLSMVIGVTMATLYTLIWRRLRARSNRRRRNATGGETAVDSSAKNIRRTSKIFFATTLLIFIALLPHYIIVVIFKIAHFDGNPACNVLYNVAVMFPYINSMGNPLVYSLVSPRFRRDAKTVLVGLRFFQCHVCVQPFSFHPPAPGPIPISSCPTPPQQQSTHMQQATGTPLRLQSELPECIPGSIAANVV